MHQKEHSSSYEELQGIYYVQCSIDRIFTYLYRIVITLLGA